MRQRLSRRGFVAAGSGVFAAIAGGALASPASAAQDGAEPKKAAPRPDKGPRIDLDLVQEFVGAAHRDLDRVRSLLESKPALVNAAWDWGGGDWETALGAAAHTGRANIALYLLEHNARLDLYAAAMLGRLDFVKAALETFPGQRIVPGPHGIPLLAHAKAGGDDAARVVEYLESLA